MCNKSATLCLALFLALVEFGSCFQCYHCDSHADVRCGKSFSSNVTAIDCTSAESTRFTKQDLYNVLPDEIFGVVAGDPSFCHTVTLGTGRVLRGCINAKQNDKEKACKSMKELSKDDELSKKVVSCVVCDKDGCNGAGALSLSLPLTALTLVISYLLYKQ